MSKANTDPQQIVCTGEAGSDEWNCAFGTWSADDFGIDSDEPVGTGERLYVRRDLFDAACTSADGYKEALHDLADKSDGQAKRIAELEADPTALTKKSILAFMNSNTPNEYRDGYYFPFKYFLRALDLDVELLRGFLRSMRADGLVEYGSGFSEDGIPAGGGYSITDPGRTYLTAQGEATP